MRNKLFYLLAFCLLAFNVSCKKEEPNPDSLPPITQEGKNTFGCYINGEVWMPHAPTLFDRKITLIFGNGVTIEVQRFKEPKGTDQQVIQVGFIPDEVKPTRTYQLGENFAEATFYDRMEKHCLYSSDPEDIMEGSITITKYDLTEEKVIAGTFEFTLGKEGCETLHFTDGRFDVKVP